LSRIRIVGGEWRSRLIDVSTVKGLRPTPTGCARRCSTGWARISRQELPRSLRRQRRAGLRGASRGADKVTMVEQDAVAFAALQGNAKTLQAARVQLVRGDALKFARSAGPSHDVVFLDPPYRAGWIEQMAPLLPGLLTEEGWSMWKRNTKSKTLSD
jgi:16S rRNA G966 N2-methylase RsmD